MHHKVINNIECGENVIFFINNTVVIGNPMMTRILPNTNSVNHLESNTPIRKTTVCLGQFWVGSSRG